MQTLSLTHTMPMCIHMHSHLQATTHTHSQHTQCTHTELIAYPHYTSMKSHTQHAICTYTMHSVHALSHSHSLHAHDTHALLSVVCSQWVHIATSGHFDSVPILCTTALLHVLQFVLLPSAMVAVGSQQCTKLG